MRFYGWQPYVPVAARRRLAERNLAELRKDGAPVAPVRIEGRTIARSFWGKSWCANLERYSDYANRLPRGRSYVRNGSVIDLQITRGEVVAKVMGSSLYTVKIGIQAVPVARWKGICGDCAGSVDSLVELLQGRLAKSVMDRVCREGDGLFPAPAEIKLSCSCPDWADMCKHVAAVLYGVGARLDASPQLVFVLRGVDENELLAKVAQSLPAAQTASSAKLLDEGDVAALFGLDMAGTMAVATVAATPEAATPRAKISRASKKSSAGKPAAKASSRVPAPAASKRQSGKTAGKGGVERARRPPPATR
jgi:uncharacterized Zn finger protein